MVARLLEQDEDRREKQRTAGYVSTWNAPLFDNAIERRRLRFMSTLFCALSRCGCRIDGKAPEGRLFTILVGHQYVRVAFPVEEVRTRKSARSGADPGAEKRLGFVLDVAHDGSGKGAHSWNDETAPLESQVQDIVVQLIVHAEAEYRDDVLRGHRARKERKARLEEAVRVAQAEAVRKEKERQERLERERVDRLLGEAASLARAQEIRRYVGEVKKANAASADPMPVDEIEAWSAWALRQADRIDPVRSGAFRKPHDADEAPMT